MILTTRCNIRVRQPEIWLSAGSCFVGSAWKPSKQAKYGFAVDRWAAGMLLYYMELGDNVFGLDNTSSDLVCLHRMLSYVGVPTVQMQQEHNWIQVTCIEAKRQLPFDTAVQKVAAELLALDPSERLAANAAYQKLAGVEGQ